LFFEIPIVKNVVRRIRESAQKSRHEALPLPFCLARFPCSDEIGIEDEEEKILPGPDYMSSKMPKDEEKKAAQ
jgi:hypothetical protein